MIRFISLWGPVALYMASIFYVSAQPKVPLPPGLFDKQAHLVEYAVLGVLLVRALGGGLPVRVTPRLALLAVALTTLYGISDEIHQMFVPGRSPNPYDVAADAIGGALGAGACWLWGILSKPKGQGARTNARKSL